MLDDALDLFDTISMILHNPFDLSLISPEWDTSLDSV